MAIADLEDMLPECAAANALANVGRGSVSAGALAAVKKLTLIPGEESEDRWRDYVRLIGKTEELTKLSEWFSEVWRRSVGVWKRQTELLDVLSLALEAETGGSVGSGLAGAVAAVLATATRSETSTELLGRILEVVGFFGGEIIRNKPATGRVVAVLLKNHASFSVKRMLKTPEDARRTELILELIARLPGCPKTGDAFLEKAEELAEIQHLTHLFPTNAFIRAVLASALVDDSTVFKRRIAANQHVMQILINNQNSVQDAKDALNLIQLAGVKFGYRGE
jgi:hypothetical protein